MKYNDTLIFYMLKYNQEKKHWFQENRVQEITQHEIYIYQDIHSQIINGQEIGRPDTRRPPGKDIGVYRLLWAQPTRTRNQDSEVQIIYMIKQVLKSKISKSKIFDRTPICDPFLRLIFEKTHIWKNQNWKQNYNEIFS